MRIQRIPILMIVIAATLIIAAYAGAALSTGGKAPDFTLPILDGKTFTLSEQSGKVVVLDIWSTMCPPCRAEIPYLVAANKKLRDKGVVFVGVALDRSKESLRGFVKNEKIDYTIALDPSASKIGSDYKVTSIPATYIIDKHGVIRAFHSGFPYSDKGAQKAAIAEIEKEVSDLLAEK